MRYLPMQVGDFDVVKVHDAQAADARARKIQNNRAAKASCAHYKYTRSHKLLLSGRSNLWQQHLARVAPNSVGVHVPKGPFNVILTFAMDIDPVYLALSKLRKRQFDACIDICTRLLQENPLDQVRICISGRCVKCAEASASRLLSVAL